MSSGSDGHAARACCWQMTLGWARAPPSLPLCSLSGVLQPARPLSVFDEQCELLICATPLGCISLHVLACGIAATAVISCQLKSY